MTKSIKCSPLGWDCNRIYNGETELTKGPESGNYIPGLHTGYSEVGVVHMAIHWIGAMYQVITSIDIDKSKWRDKGKNIVEVQRSRVAF